MQMCKRISVLVSFILLFFSAQSQSWQPLGLDDFNEPSFNPATNTSMVCDATGQLYLAFNDGYTSTGQVRKFNGTTWEQVGTPNVYLGSTATDFNILMDAANIPTLVYQDVSNSRKAAIKKFVGGNWVSYGTGVISQGPAYNLVAATDASGKLYCAYADGSLGYNLTLSVGSDA
jgi:hypothetical protein